MSIIADTHVHLYPVYDTGATLIRLAQSLGGLAVAAGLPAAARVACLVERQGQHVFRDLHDGKQGFPGDAVSVRAAGEPGALAVNVPGGTLYLLAGRQFVGRERIEVLGLGVDLVLSDGDAAHTYIERILAAGGAPVLSWAPGKWFFKRGRVVRELMRRFGPQLLLGDTTLRPRGWGEPFLMRAGRRQGVRVLAGSDPLPFAGDERVAGTYATLLEAPFDPERPVTSVLAALRAATPAPRLVGRRGGPLEVAARLRGNALTKI